MLCAMTFCRALVSGCAKVLRGGDIRVVWSLISLRVITAGGNVRSHDRLLGLMGCVASSLYCAFCKLEGLCVTGFRLLRRPGCSGLWSVTCICLPCLMVWLCGNMCDLTACCPYNVRCYLPLERYSLANPSHCLAYL